LQNKHDQHICQDDLLHYSTHSHFFPPLLDVVINYYYLSWPKQLEFQKGVIYAIMSYPRFWKSKQSKAYIYLVPCSSELLLSNEIFWVHIILRMQAQYLECPWDPSTQELALDSFRQFVVFHPMFLRLCMSPQTLDRCEFLAHIKVKIKKFHKMA